MRILSITAQKPNSTGSGVYLTELVKEYEKEGHSQAVVAGVYKDDIVELPEGVRFYPVFFESASLPYPIVGMSDEMPYKSTRYSDMSPEMTRQFKDAFLAVVRQAVEELNPDLILCHHLYLLTAVVRAHFPEQKIYGFCHNTDLRQMRKTDLEREFIREQMNKLNHIFVPQKAQEEGVLKIYGTDPDKITQLGMGYNSEIFCKKKEKSLPDGKTKIVFAGKIAEKKGVMSLLRALSLLEQRSGEVFKRDNLQLFLAGSTGNEEEYAVIRALAKECPYETVFLGRISQPKLAELYNACDIFVLPSFFEGIPLTVIEAIACGNRVVMTDLPGIQTWISQSVPKADIRYVKMPAMRNTDEPVLEELPAFEERLAEELAASILQGKTRAADVSGISWSGISRKVLKSS